MSHRNAVVFCSKSVLAFAIAFVISGWALGQDSGKTSNTGQSQPIKGVTILELEECNVTKQNKIPAQDTSNKYLPPDETGFAGLKKGKGSALDLEGRPPDTTKVVGKDETAAVPSDQKVIVKTKEEGLKSINLQGEELIIEQGGTITSNLSSGEPPEIYMIKSTAGTGTNEGTINVNDETQNPSYGMQSFGSKLSPNVQGDAKALNSGTINVTSPGGVGLSTDTNKGTLNNLGTINTSDGTTGIKVSGGGKLENVGTVKGAGTGLSFEGEFSNGISIQSGDVQGSPAIEITPATAVSPLLLYGGSFKGDIKGSGSRDKNNTLAIAPENEHTPVSIKGDISGFPGISISETGWSVSGWISDATTLGTSSLINNLLASDQPESLIEPSGAGTSLKFATTADSAESLNIRTQEQGKVENLHLHGVAQLGDVQGLGRIYVHSSKDWSVAGSLENPAAIKIESGGGAKSISTGAGIGTTTPEPKTLALTFENYTHKEFLVENHGTLESLDFSSADRPPLHYIQKAGTTNSIKGRSELGDKLTLIGGKIADPVSGIPNVEITGAGWITAAVQDPVNVEVTDSGKARVMTTRGVNSDVGPLTLPLKFAQKTEPHEKVTLNTSGIIGEIKFDDPAAAKRPPINIIQKGGIIGSIQSQLGKGDTLDVQDGTVAGDIIRLDSLAFSGQKTEFGGQRIETMGTVSVTGTLILTSDQTVSVTPVKAGKNQSTPGAVIDTTTLHIAKDGTLHAKPPAETESYDLGTVLEVTGTYKQEGRLEVPLDQQRDPKVPYVKATKVEIGPEAVVFLDNKRDLGDKTEYLLMQSDSDINATPTLKMSELSRYTRIYPKRVARQLFVASISRGTYIGDLARSGGANKSAVKAIETAVDRKSSKSLSLLSSGDSDRLSTWLLNKCEKDDDNPVKVANIADQMTPDLSGATVSPAVASIRQASSAVGARQSSLRNGNAASDMVASGKLWLQYAYSDATQDKKDLYPGYEAKTNGFTLGVDSDLNEMMTLGVAYTYSKSDVKGTDGSKKTIDAEAHTLSAYFSAEQGPMFVDGRLGYTWGENDAQRYVADNEIKAKYDVNSWDVGLLSGYKMPLSAEWSWIPQLTFNYASIKPDEYQDKYGTGQSAILMYDRVKSDTYEIMELGAGLKLLGDIATTGMSIKPEVSLMAYHDFKDDPVTMTAHFAQGGNAFVMHGAEREQSRYQFGAAANMETSNNLTFNLSYSYDWMDSYKTHGFIARASYAF
ncbi:autotransporter outer membrane beta-barrel domain-containing protein [Endozoicomonas sp. 4G]|uniref:autotransporter outer membrane beta-barrel domain-containing protein n=1 Tax=Endozoicomonas sp. 4G TaxID=2872754 RepID=UPI002078FCC9|nr:autotransporter outer membrane beta-barrel domain-containing protein [Endozoicomonas sp. 4G]